MSTDLGTSTLPEHPIFETAAEHACTRVPVVSLDYTAGHTREMLIGGQFECVTHIVVCEGRKFRGLVRMEELFAASDADRIESMMDSDAPFVAPGIDQEVAAWRAVQHGESALAVVDKDGSFTGIIPPHRLLGVLLSEHHEDLARLGGYLKSTRDARITSVEPVLRRFWHRVPWLLVGLFGALAAADIMGRFEAQLRSQVLLAFFVPGVVYLADAVGTQTETVVVRGFSVGVRLRKIMRRELLAGVVIGMALALIAFPLILLRWGDWQVALTVGLSLFAACSTATLAAMGLPSLLVRLGLDPAFGSGPLATVVQDLVSIFVYFAIASLVLTD